MGAPLPILWPNTAAKWEIHKPISEPKKCQSRSQSTQCIPQLQESHAQKPNFLPRKNVQKATRNFHILSKAETKQEAKIYKGDTGIKLDESPQ